jgi:hypothetical protein
MNPSTVARLESFRFTIALRTATERALYRPKKDDAVVGRRQVCAKLDNIPQYVMDLEE